MNEDGSADVETLWATHLGADEYKLDNSPFYAYGAGRRVFLRWFDRQPVGRWSCADV
jgi:hypothetical protein